MNTFAADPSGNFNEAVDELFQHPFVDECKEIMSILLSNAYCLFCFEKKRIFNVSPADPSSSFNEAVDELFQQLLVEKYIEHDVSTSATCVNCLFCIK